MSERQKILNETSHARDEADALLRVLMEAKTKSEQHLRDTGQVDAFKRVTGKSSLENAIASTKRMVETLDRTVAVYKRDLAELDAELVAR